METFDEEKVVFENYKNMLYIPTIQNIKTKVRLYIC